MTKTSDHQWCGEWQAIEQDDVRVQQDGKQAHDGKQGGTQVPHDGKQAQQNISQSGENAEKQAPKRGRGRPRKTAPPA